eukprot:COSAG05_NODE_1495_length_4710_cov_19.079592_5_plen_280_part_00
MHAPIYLRPCTCRFLGMVRQEHGPEAELDAQAALMCCTAVAAASPLACKVSQAEQRLEAARQEAESKTPAGPGIVEVNTPDQRTPPKPRPKVEHPDYKVIPPDPGCKESHYATQEYLKETDVTWTGYSASAGKEVDGSDLYKVQEAASCINDKPRMNWSDEEIEKYGLRIKLKPGCQAPKPDAETAPCRSRIARSLDGRASSTSGKPPLVPCGCRSRRKGLVLEAARHLVGGSRRHPPHRACVLLCVLAVWLCGQVTRLRQARIGCRRRAEWLGGVRLG